MENRSVKDKVINFKDLSDWDCALLIQNYLLEALEIEDETYLEWEIVSKLASVFIETRKNLCDLFDSALKRNHQKVAGKEINQWLQQYEHQFPPGKLDLGNYLEFVLKNNEQRKLSPNDQRILAKILRLHDYLFVKPFQNLSDKFVSNILRTPIRNNLSLEEVKQKISFSISENKTFAPAVSEKLPLRELLKKYPAVGEQTITANQLKLSHFDRPVRPSVRNWLYDYTSQLGQERHDSMQRMKYLFSSVNGKNLSSPDREKLGIILKSFDENTPLAVDTGRNEIVFEPSATRATGQSPTFPSLAVARDSSKSDFSPQPAPTSFTKPSPPIRETIAPERETKPPTPSPSFVKPYSPIRETKVPERETTPVTAQSKGKTEPFNQSSTFPFADKSANSSKSNFSEMRFVNPYPKPGTHEPQSAKPAENISNIRFNEGLPKKPLPQQNFPPQPQTKSAVPPVPPKISFSRPRRNIIEPIGRTKPEPRIEGNVVDLKGDNK